MAQLQSPPVRAQRPTPVRNRARTQTAIKRLKEAALELIAEGGVAALTIGALTRRSGYSTAMVSCHFGSKANFIQHLSGVR